MLWHGRLRWFGHFEHKNRDWVVEGKKGRGIGRKTWHECGVEHMRKLKLRKEEARNQLTWRRVILGNRHKTDDDDDESKYRTKWLKSEAITVIF